MTEIGSTRSSNDSDLRKYFYGSSGLRAGWRLCIFLAIVAALMKATNLMVGRLLPGADPTALFVIFLVINFLIFLVGSWTMGRIEGRTIADYGLPWAPHLVEHLDDYTMPKGSEQ
jgi:hypothetical protein